jgi:hypothetical protein
MMVEVGKPCIYAGLFFWLEAGNKPFWKRVKQATRRSKIITP